MAVGSEVQTTIDSSHIRVVDRVIRGLSNSRLFALTLGSPQDNVAVIERLTLEAQTAVA